MALRGETIGRAYVRILADGSGLPQSIKDEMENVEPVIKAEGRHHGEAYAEEFKNRASQEDIGAGIRDSLERSVARSDVAESFFNSRNWKRFIGRLKQEFGDAGIVAGHELETKFAHNIDGINDAIEKDLLPNLDKIGARIRDADDKETLGKLTDDMEDLGDESGRTRTKLGFFARFVARSLVPNLIHANVAMRDGTRSWERWGDQVGRIFGKGSRNNLVNFIGSLIGNLVRLPAIISDVVEKFAGFAAEVGATFVNAGGGIAGFITVLSSLASTVVVAGIALAAFAVLLGVITSLVSLLIGAIVALASSISFALIGSIAALAGALLPVAGLVGGIVLAISGLTKAMKSDLKEAFKPVIDGFNEIKKAAGQELTDTLVDIAPRIARGFEILKPLLLAITDSLGIFVEEFSEIVGSPAFKEFSEELSQSMPNLMRNLGEIAKKLGRILFGLFRGVIPLAQEFLRWLRPILNDFAEWINSTKGQKELKDFLRDAGDSAKSLGDFLNGVWDVVKKLFFSDSGKKTGDSLLTQMGDALSRFADWIDDKDLKQWFEDSKEFAENIGDMVDSISHLVDVLDTPTNRDTVNFFLDLSVIAFDFIAGGIEAVAIAIGHLRGESDFDTPGWLTFLEGFDVETIFGNIVDGLGNLFTDPTNWGPFEGIRQNIANFTTGAGNMIADWWNGLWEGIRETFADWWHNLGSSFGPNSLTALIPGASIAHAIIDKIGDINLKDLFNVAGVIPEILGSLPTPSQIIAKMAFTLSRIFEGLGSVAGDILGALPSPSEMIGKMAFDIFKVVEGAGTLKNDILGLFPTAAEILAWIGEVVINISVNLIGEGKGLISGLVGNLADATSASGGVFAGAQTRIIGEEGPEAIVPLNRPLWMVDPAVRELSAIAQGKQLPPGGRSATVDVGGITVITPTEDPFAVAHEVINQLVGSAYF